MCVFVCMHAHAQLCSTLCNPIDCSPPGSSVHGIFQARILEWVTIFYSRGSSQPFKKEKCSVAKATSRLFYKDILDGYKNIMWERNGIKASFWTTQIVLLLRKEFFKVKSEINENQEKKQRNIGLKEFGFR